MKGFIKTIFLAALLCALGAVGATQAAATDEGLAAWLDTLPLPDEAKADFLGKAERAGSGSSGARTGWTASGPDMLYALGGAPVPKKGNAALQARLKTAAQGRSELQAMVALGRHLAGGRLNATKYQDPEATDHALNKYFSARLPGVQSRSTVIGGMAWTMLWTGGEELRGAEAAPLAEKELTPSYCEHLYARAGELMKSGQYEEALNAFHRIHYMEWGNVDAYLNASNCFLKLKKESEAVRLTRELLQTLEPRMKANELARAGQILFYSGEKDEGFATLERACALAGVLPQHGRGDN